MHWERSQRTQAGARDRPRLGTCPSNRTRLNGDPPADPARTSSQRPTPSTPFYFAPAPTPRFARPCRTTTTANRSPRPAHAAPFPSDSPLSRSSGPCSPCLGKHQEALRSRTLSIYLFDIVLNPAPPCNFSTVRYFSAARRTSFPIREVVGGHTDVPCTLRRGPSCSRFDRESPRIVLGATQRLTLWIASLRRPAPPWASIHRD